MKKYSYSLLIIFFFFAHCAYFNTFFNAKKYFNDAEKQREERLKKAKKQKQQGVMPEQNERGLNPDRPSAQEAKNYDLSIEKASKVLEFYPKSKYIDDALFLLGKCFFRKLDYQKAERKFIELRENFPNSEFIAESQLWLGKTYIEMRNYETAEEIFHQLLNSAVKDQIQDEARFLLGGLFKHKKDFVTAASEFETAASRAKDKEIRAKSYYEMGECNFDLKNYAKAVESYMKARKYSPDERIEYDALFRAAQTYQKMQQYDDAINIFTNLLGNIANEDSWPACRLEIAHCYRLNGNFETAVSWYLDIIEKHPKSVEAADAYFYLGEINLNQKAEYEFAKEYFDKAPLENTRSEKANEARAKSKSIKDLLELRANIKAQEEKIVKGDSLAAVIENFDDNPEDRNKSFLQFSHFDTLVASAMEIPLDSLPVYQDTLMSLYVGKFKDYDNAIMNPMTQPQQKLGPFKASLLDSLLSVSLKLPFAYLEDYQDSLRNVYNRYYPIFKKNKMLYDLYRNKDKKADVSKKNLGDSPLEALIKAKLSLAEIYLLDFSQPDSAMMTYLDILRIDTSKVNFPKTLYSLGYIAETFKKDTVLADSMFERLIREFPDDPFTQKAKKQIVFINIPDPEVKIAEQYKSAELAYLDRHDYDEALSIFSTIADEYPASDFAPRSLLAQGWIFEFELDSINKAFLTYQALLEKYPDSPYAAQIKKKVEVVKKAKATEQAATSAEQKKQPEVQLADASAEAVQQPLSIADSVSMDKAQYRQLLLAEMQKNDPRRTSPRRW